MATLLLTGATGFLGPWILQDLDRGGWARTLGIDSVRVLARSRDGAASLSLMSVPLEVRPGDLRDPASVRNAAMGADAVMHAAALCDTHSPCVNWYREARPRAR